MMPFFILVIHVHAFLSRCTTVMYTLFSINVSLDMAMMLRTSSASTHTTNNKATPHSVVRRVHYRLPRVGFDGHICMHYWGRKFCTVAVIPNEAQPLLHRRKHSSKGHQTEDSISRERKKDQYMIL